MFQAVNVKQHRVAACKLIYIKEHTTANERKTVDKEIKIHNALKHQNVLEFISAITVELEHKDYYVPGVYILLEFAAGGDLFDKIRAYRLRRVSYRGVHICDSSGCRCQRGCGTYIFQAVGGRDGTPP